VLALAARGAVNFHDGPLPDYAGLNAPVWALLNGETRHGVTWHLIGGGVDDGAILEQRMVGIAPDETALTLNAKCYAAAIESFQSVVAALEGGVLSTTEQDPSRRRYFARADRPAAAARLDFARPAAELARLVRALDHGGYANRLACPKIEAGGRVLLVARAEEAGEAGAAPGTVLAADSGGITVATGAGALRLSGLADPFGRPVEPAAAAAPGDVLPSPGAAEAERLRAAIAAAAPAEEHWRRRLRALEPAELAQAARGGGGAPRHARIELPRPDGMAPAAIAAGLAALVARTAGRARLDLAFRDDAIARAAAAAPGHLSPWVPVGFEADPDGDGGTPFEAAAAAFAARLDEAARLGTFALDLVARDPEIAPFATPAVALATGAEEPVPGAALTLAIPEAGPLVLLHDAARLPAAEAEGLAARLGVLLAAAAEAGDTPVARLPLLPPEERARLLHGWNDTALAHDRGATVHGLVEAQAARTPGATALVFEGERLTYAQLDARANRVAHALRAAGVGPETIVGLHVPRSPELVIGALAIQKAGGAYLPLDPAYPAERLALYLSDSAAPVVLTRSDVRAALPPSEARAIEIDRDAAVLSAPEAPAEGGAGPESLAYVIYTSGSTGRPKGVMVEHRNVANFFAGMDARIPHDPPGTWLAVTSLSFDISVLELFWTLARGFTVVLSGEESRALVSSGRLPLAPERHLDFSLFYWGNDDGVGPKKYELLLEGAKFADARGFRAVWTPERHFHAFGGPYPNPSVTGAAVAAVTESLEVRAGSCVAPLHHPIRIAEEWAVIDNLTNGRTGLAIASGWHPDDFVLRPENTPPDNKPAMYRAIEELRRLWRGEAVEFPTRSGGVHAVVTQPRPVSRELPIWVTTAGNPETWKEAGRIGANVLTHLLGQSVEEVGEKIALYREALAEAGHDPDAHTVTLMLHTCVGADREAVRETAREPMKDYLRSAAGLIKQYAWAFPAFKRPQGVSTPFELDLQTLSAEEMEAILDFAFQRYFEDSGLFGTVADCLARVEQVKRIGVDEIACLIDYGIAPATVLQGLEPLAEVLARANAPAEIAEDDFSIAAQILRHRVTHLQCTPSMARMIAMNEEGRAALGRVDTLMLGGEALPGALVDDLRRAGCPRIETMYGPTETTIWSSTGPAEGGEGIASIGRPIANTRLYVLDEALEPVPAGVAGELWIGGEGVVRGYLHRGDLTAERFRADPFAPPPPAGAPEPRMYRTGDLVRWREDGTLDFLGRTDHQVKIRGHRIELGEIEARLASAPGVREAVVLAREDTPGDTRLVGYVTAGAPVEEAALAAHVAAALPAHMVPSRVVVLEAMPLTPNRKIDRGALPAPGAPARPAGAEAAAAEAPEGEVAGTIAEIWARVLGVGHVGASDNFFELGGHSLLAVQAHREIRQALGTAKLTITDIFRFPVLSQLAAHLDERPAAPGPEAEPAAAAPVSGRAEARAEAMARRRALRAGRRGGGG
jgi:natural product biosynthesis luciferase-like monooxygenase protein